MTGALLKALSDNAERDGVRPTAEPAPVPEPLNNSMAPTCEVPPLRAIRVISVLKDCQTVVERLAQTPVLAVDSEGVNLGPDGPITLLQVSEGPIIMLRSGVYRYFLQ